MSKFNPYREWFGLDGRSKPSYYELLGVRNFETEPPVIAEAAECRLQLLAPHKSGPHAEVAERLGREVTGVMNLLLNPEKRRKYDEQLGQERGGGATTAEAPSSLADPYDNSLEAADSPTAMLPLGALNLPPMQPAPAPAYADPYAGYAAPPGAMPNAPYAAGPMPQAAQPYGAAPPYAPGQPQAPYGAPQNPAMGGQPMGYPPGYAQAPPQPFGAPAYGQPQYGAMPNDPYGQQPPPAYGAAPGMPYGAAAPAAPYGAAMPGVGPGTMPQQAFSPAPSFPAAGPAPLRNSAPPATSGGSFKTSNVSERSRVSGLKRQKSSTIMIAVGVLGGAAAVLTLAILAASAGKSRQTAAVPPKKIVAKPPNAFSSEDMARMQATAARNSPTYQGGEPPRNVVSRPFEGSPGPRSQSFDSMPGDGMASNTPPMNNAMPATPNMPAPATPPSTPPPSPFGTPSLATPSTVTTTTAAMPAPGTTPTTPAAPAMPAGPTAVPVIAGLPPSQMEMASVLPADEVRGKSVNTMLGSVRTNAKSRNYAKAEEIALTAQISADTPELIKAAHEHGHALELVRAFWAAVHEGVKSLKEGEELKYDGKTAVVVKHDDLTLVVKQDNKDVVLQIAKLAPGLAVQLSERSLPAESAATKLTIAAFLALDQAGNRDQAATLLDQAVALGSGDIVGLRAVLEATP
jgi:hypothetical protein